MAAFQSGKGDLFLISLKAGGQGLNLTAADYVIHLDPWWNPAVEDQASDRAYRLGQQRPVTVYRLDRGGVHPQAPPFQARPRRRRPRRHGRALERSRTHGSDPQITAYLTMKFVRR